MPPARREPAGAAVQRPAVTEAIHAAVLETLAERGYGRTSVEAVAKRAGVGKAAVYRRWPSKLELVIDVVSAAAVRPQDVPDTGGFVTDVRAWLPTLRRLLEHPQAQRILTDLVAEAARTPELDRLLEDAVGGPRRALAQAVLDRAVTRGELPDGTDRELALDVLPGPLYWRIAVRRHPITDDELDRLATALVAAVRALAPG